MRAVAFEDVAFVFRQAPGGKDTALGFDTGSAGCGGQLDGRSG